MSEATHSQGEWTATLGPQTKDGQAQVWCRQSDTYALRICDVWNRDGWCNKDHWFPGQSSPEMDANARLMAAAPDLLKALRTCVLTMEALGLPVPPHTREAIAKATGETP